MPHSAALPEAFFAYAKTRTGAAGLRSRPLPDTGFKARAQLPHEFPQCPQFPGTPQRNNFPQNRHAASVMAAKKTP
jgi:hypothetical protein